MGETRMAERLRVGIIGSGIAGLTVASSLQTIADVTVFEKSRGVGGRMATRRIGDVSFDHGAQYFTVRDEDFRLEMDGAFRAGLVTPWTGDVVSLMAGGPERRVVPSTTRYVAVPSMTALPKAMAEGLDIRLEFRVAEIVGEPGRWHIRSDDAVEGPFDWVVATAPAPQTAALLPASFSHHDTLREVGMHACFTLMIKRDSSVAAPFAAAYVSDPVIGWIAYNQTKPGRAAPATLVVNSNGVWADANIDMPLDAVRRLMIESLQSIIAVEAMEVESAVIHRWRYADVHNPARQSFLLDQDAQLAACGDWCIAGRVEAAYLSGRSLAMAMTSMSGS